MWLLGGVVRRYIDFLILLIPTPLVSVIFYRSIPTFCSFFKMFFVLVPVLFKLHFMYEIIFSRSINTHTGNYGASHGIHMKAANTVLYMNKHIQTYASYPAMDISCMSVV